MIKTQHGVISTTRGCDSAGEYPTDVDWRISCTCQRYTWLKTNWWAGTGISNISRWCRCFDSCWARRNMTGAMLTGNGALSSDSSNWSAGNWAGHGHHLWCDTCGRHLDWYVCESERGERVTGMDDEYREMLCVEVWEVRSGRKEEESLEKTPSKMSGSSRTLIR